MSCSNFIPLCFHAGSESQILPPERGMHVAPPQSGRKWGVHNLHWLYMSKSLAEPTIVDPAVVIVWLYRAMGCCVTQDPFLQLCVIISKLGFALQGLADLVH